MKSNNNPLKKTQQKKPVIGITLGDPSGIGPEVIAKALSLARVNCLGTFQIIGDANLFKRYAQKSIRNASFIDLKNTGINFPIGKINKKSGQASLQYLDVALALLKKKEISALVTGPVCKEAVQLINPSFCGHTEYLAQFFHVKKYEMMFVTDHLKVVVATRHIPLRSVSEKITKDIVSQAILMTNQSLKKFFRIKNPKIAVCGLNPHAGEGGRIGCEEIESIIPAVKKAKKSFVDITGPLAADTLFHPEMVKHYDAVIAMYHDQGLIAMKATSLDRLVNFTIGLPIIRTSPAHGTAFDIAGKNRANPSSMIASIELAARLCV